MSTNTDQIAERVRDGGMDGLLDFAKTVLAEAILGVPPTDVERDPHPLLTLKEDGRIERDGDGFIIVFENPYATKVHEAVGYQHRHGGGAKYLERALTGNLPRLESVMASWVRANVDGSVVNLQGPNRWRGGR